MYLGLIFTCLLFLATSAEAQFDLIVTNKGDSIFGEVYLERDDYKPKNGDTVLQVRNRVLRFNYNGYNGIVFISNKNEVHYLEASQIKSYTQQKNSLGKNASSIRPPHIPRPKGEYKQFDLGTRKIHFPESSLRMRYVFAIEAQSVIFDYPLKHNSPYKLYISYLASEEFFTKCYILHNGDETFLFSNIRQLLKTSKLKGISTKFWKKGGGDLEQRLLRFQFALNKRRS